MMTIPNLYTLYAFIRQCGVHIHVCTIIVEIRLHSMKLLVLFILCLAVSAGKVTLSFLTKY